MEEDEVGGGSYPNNSAGRRKEDTDGWAKVFSFFVRFNWVATILFAFFLMLGFGFETPQKTFTKINERVSRNWVLDSIQLHELRVKDTEGREERRQLKMLVESLVIMECRASPRVAQDNRLPCRRLFREWGLE
jgi:hypothetical protein